MTKAGTLPELHLPEPAVIASLPIDVLPNVLAQLMGLMFHAGRRLVSSPESTDISTSATELDPLLLPEEVAKILGIPQSHVYDLARRGSLPKVKVGEKYVRFRRSDIQRWIDQRSDPGLDAAISATYSATGGRRPGAKGPTPARTDSGTVR